MIYAQLNPNGNVINLPRSEVHGSPEHAADRHIHAHDAVWAHLQAVASGVGAPLIGLADGSPLPEIGQRWDAATQTFGDCPVWLQERADLIAAEANEAPPDRAAVLRAQSAVFAKRALAAGRK